MTDAPSPFSASNPKLQRAWDATSFRALMQCPRKYQYSIIEGWRTAEASVHLEFGGYFAKAVETYKKARLGGDDKVRASMGALRYVLEATWVKQYEDGNCPCPDGCNGCELPQYKPWGGRYEEMWRCTGSEPYKNSKGNRAKCPWSHKGIWLSAPSPGMCGECGSACETSRQWISDNKAKDRHTLVRLVISYCDEQSEDVSEGPYPYMFPDGTPAVELSFRLPLPWKTPTPLSKMADGSGIYLVNDPSRETYLLCGHLDSIMQFAQERFISDNKTTKNPLSPAFFDSFGPDIQVDIYDLSGSLLYPSLDLRGVMIEGAQVLQTDNHHGVGMQYRNDAQREELLGDLRYWLDQAEDYAKKNYWPMNRASCKMCEFKSVCTKDPGKRQMYLESNFVRRPWNPLEER